MADEVPPKGDGDGGPLRPPQNDMRAQALVDAIHAGEVDLVVELVTETQDLAARLVNAKGGSGSPLHAVTDWPGYYPNGPEIVSILIDAGADPNIPVEGSWHAETPLHWAASSDDVEVAPESVKRFETRSIHELCATSSRTGGLIHATSGIFGAFGGRCRNRVGLAT